MHLDPEKPKTKVDKAIWPPPSVLQLEQVKGFQIHKHTNLIPSNDQRIADPKSSQVLLPFHMLDTKIERLQAHMPAHKT